MRNKKTVQLFHHYALPPSGAGVTRHFTLLKEIGKRGFSPFLIAANRHHRQIKDIPLPKNMHYRHDEALGVSMFFLKTLTNSASKAKRVLNMVSFAWRIFRKTAIPEMPRADIVIGCTPDLFSALMSYRYARKTGAAFVFHVGEIWPLMLVELAGVPKHHPFILLFSWIEAYLYKNADAIIVAQQYGERHIAGVTAKHAPVHYIPNAVDINEIAEASHVPREGQPFKVYYIGAMGRANNMDAILDAAKICLEQDNDEIVFHFIGDGTEKNNLMARAVDEDMTNIHFHESVPKSEIYDRIKEADCFIVNVPDKKPYEYGLAHNKFFDYMAMGRPTVIGTNTFENPITEYDCGICVGSDDAIGMAESIIKIKNLDETAYKKMSANAQRGIRERYNFQTLGQELADILTEVAPRKR